MIVEATASDDIFAIRIRNSTPVDSVRKRVVFVESCVQSTLLRCSVVGEIREVDHLESIVHCCYEQAMRKRRMPF